MKKIAFLILILIACSPNSIYQPVLNGNWKRQIITFATITRNMGGTIATLSLDSTELSFLQNKLRINYKKTLADSSFPYFDTTAIFDYSESNQHLTISNENIRSYFAFAVSADSLILHFINGDTIKYGDTSYGLPTNLYSDEYKYYRN